MEKLGYYAKDKFNELHQFEWSPKNELILIKITPNGKSRITVNPNNYEIIEVGYFKSIPYKPIFEDVPLTPSDIIGVSPIEYVVDGKNFEDLVEAYLYWEGFKKKGEFLEVFSRVWVSLSDEAIVRNQRPEGSVECNFEQIDFINNYSGKHKDNRNTNSIAYELWEWVKDTAAPIIGLLPFQITWDDVNGHLGLMSIEHPKYNLTFDEILNDIITIDHLELGGRGFIEFGENVAKQNVDAILDLMERYRGATLV